MENLLSTPIQKDNHTLKIVYDTDPINPRDDDNIAELLYLKGRYVLGDVAVTQTEIDERMADDEYWHIPYYAYIHGGVALSTKQFSCPWDSGCCGIACININKYIKEFGEWDENVAMGIINAELETYTKYLNGEVYGYVIEKNGEIEDSCFGFYDTDAALENGKDSLHHIVTMEKDMPNEPFNELRKVILDKLKTGTHFKCQECGVGINPGEEIFVVAKNELEAFESHQCIADHYSTPFH